MCSTVLYTNFSLVPAAEFPILRKISAWVFFERYYSSTSMFLSILGAFVLYCYGGPR